MPGPVLNSIKLDFWPAQRQNLPTGWVPSTGTAARLQIPAPQPFSIPSSCIQTDVSICAPDRRSLADELFDVVVIGGGINGVGIARETARAGLRTLLLEQNDFASGTTSRSTRIIHGGLRYLQYGEIGLVRESLAEREHLLRERQHLVRPIDFVLALPENAQFSSLQVRSGLWIYRQLAGRHPVSVPTRQQLREIETQLEHGHRWMLFHYDDAQCEFPERLVAEWLLEAYDSGAVIRNHAKVQTVMVDRGRVQGVLFHDQLTAEDQYVYAQWVINAAGPWADQVCASAAIDTGGPMVGGVRGSHIVLPRWPGAPESAIYTQATDGRPIFVIPWNGQMLVGTTEVPDSGDPSRVQATTPEIAYLISSLNSIFPHAQVYAADIRYAFAGVRPLQYVPDGFPNSITRRHVLHDHRMDDAAGMFSVVGGKLTTASSLARQCLRAMGRRPAKPDENAIAIGDSSGIESSITQWARCIAGVSGISEGTARGIAIWHGRRALGVARLAASEERMRQRLCPHTTHIVAEAVDSMRCEFAVTLGDVLLRRVPVALSGCWSAECSRQAAYAIGAALRWDEKETELRLEALEAERTFFLQKPDRIGLSAADLRPTQRAS